MLSVMTARSPIAVAGADRNKGCAPTVNSEDDLLHVGDPHRWVSLPGLSLL